MPHLLINLVKSFIARRIVPRVAFHFQNLFGTPSPNMKLPTKINGQGSIRFDHGMNACSSVAAPAKISIMRTFSRTKKRRPSMKEAFRNFDAGTDFPMRAPARLERAAAMLGVRLLRLLIVVLLFVLVIFVLIIVFFEILAQREQRLLLYGCHRTNGVLDELDGLLWRYANLAAQVLLKFDAVRVQGFTAHRDSEGFHRSISLDRSSKNHFRPWNGLSPSLRVRNQSQSVSS